MLRGLAKYLVIDMLITGIKTIPVLAMLILAVWMVAGMAIKMVIE